MLVGSLSCGMRKQGGQQQERCPEHLGAPQIISEVCTKKFQDMQENCRFLGCKKVAISIFIASSHREIIIHPLSLACLEYSLTSLLNLQKLSMDVENQL